MTILAARTAWADEARPRARLVYSVPSPCPDEASFRERLTTYSNVAIELDAKVVLQVEVHRQGRRYAGRVTLLAEREEGTREVAADRCSDVVRGLAFFSALALEMHFAEVGDPPSDVVPRASRADASAPVPPPAAAGAVRRGPSEPAEAAIARSCAVPRSASARLRWSVGVATGATTSAGTRPAYSAGIFGEARFASRPEPSVRFGAHLAAAVPHAYREGTLSFGQLWGRLDVCPIWVRFGAARVSACPLGEFGARRAALSGPVGMAQVRPWLGFGGQIAVRTTISPTAEIATSLGGVWPAIPVDFSTVAAVAFRTPPFAPFVSLELAFDASRR